MCVVYEDFGGYGFVEWFVGFVGEFVDFVIFCCMDVVEVGGLLFVC